VDGLFAEHGLDVEILDPSGGPDNVARVASGGSDFALTSVNHYLSAVARHDDLAARFVAVVVQRSPIGALVAAASELREPADLAGAKVGGDPANPQTIELLASLRHRGVAAPELVEIPDNALARAALARGEVDAIPALVDALPRRRRQAGIPLRAIRAGRDDVYASGLLAADRFSDEEAWQVRRAVVAALEQQRRRPSGGLDTMDARYADDRTEDAPEGWAMLEPFVFTGDPVGSMDAARWATTLDFLCRIRGLPRPAGESVYRPQFLIASGAAPPTHGFAVLPHPRPAR
jgi:ABC-type nitrate/sulfonate/bicarbonate transport system substrate-binding protein